MVDIYFLYKHGCFICFSFLYLVISCFSSKNLFSDNNLAYDLTFLGLFSTVETSITERLPGFRLVIELK